MSTNYYAYEENFTECPSCTQELPRTHLGKKAGGWSFLFQYNKGFKYKNIAELKEWLADKVIFDEYGAIIEQDAFWKIVEEGQQHFEYAHSEDLKNNARYPGMDPHMVIDGYRFLDCDFS